jgi:hypothetical protein
MMRKANAILLTVLTVIGLLTVTGTASAAYPTCSTGTRISTDRNSTFATLEVYYDAANGTNCAYLRHGSSIPSGSWLTSVEIWACTTNTPGAICEPRGANGTRYWNVDIGHYSSYAGKVTIDGRARCIYAYGAVDSNRDGATDKYIDINGKTASQEQPRAAHCS